MRNAYYPSYYMEPLVGNGSVFGFDLVSNLTPLATSRKTPDTGPAIATARITLAEEEASEFVFLIFVPMYQRGYRLSTVEGYRAGLRGFAFGVFWVTDMVQTTVSLETWQSTTSWLEEHMRSFRTMPSVLNPLT